MPFTKELYFNKQKMKSNGILLLGELLLRCVQQPTHVFWGISEICGSQSTYTEGKIKSGKKNIQIKIV